MDMEKEAEEQEEIMQVGRQNEMGREGSMNYRREAESKWVFSEFSIINNI